MARLTRGHLPFAGERSHVPSQLLSRRVVGRDARSGPAAGAVAAPKPSNEAALFRGLQYRLVGPSRGGRVTTVTGVPSQPRTFYMGVASGGLFRTTDGGATWVPISDGKIPVGSMGAIAVADSDPNVIYVGTGSDGVRSNVSTGRGVYKSTDGGETWQFAGLYDAGQIGAVRIHPTNPDIVWVAANGDAFKPNAERGVFKTTDGGKTWQQDAVRLATRSARWTSSCSPAIPTSSMPGCRVSSASRGRSSAARRRAASTRARTAARRSRRSRPACPAN